MKIAVMAAGAVGGYFGARLQAAGEDVAFIARGEHLTAIRANGLQIESPLGDLKLSPVRASEDPAEIGPVDAVLFAVKLWDTESAALACRPLIGPETAVVSLQNGVESADVLASALGPAHVMGGAAFIAATIAAPGVIRQTGTMARLVFAERDGGQSGRAQALLQACGRAGIEASLAPDVERTVWEKFVFLAALAAATSLARLPIGPIRSDPDGRALFRDLMAEVVAVAQARGVALDADFIEDRLAFLDSLPADMKASMLNDLERGGRLELDWLSGAVVRLGQAAGVVTPAHRLAYAALKPHREGRRP